MTVAFPLCLQVRYDCIRKEDISGIASCVFTKNGQGEEDTALKSLNPILFYLNTSLMFR